MRPLTLHPSALSDSEHDLFTESLRDLTSPTPTQDSHYVLASVGVREARAWIRGRYSTVSSDNVDGILELILKDSTGGSSLLLQQAALSAGQFFAALRLVLHVLAGQPVDPNLVFIQARIPQQTYVPPPPPQRVKTRTPSPSKNPFTSPKPTGPSVPPKPARLSFSAGNSNNPFLPPPSHPPLPPRKLSSSLHNPPPKISTTTIVPLPPLSTNPFPRVTPTIDGSAYTPSLNNVNVFRPTLDIISPKPIHPPPPSNQTVARILTTHVTSPLMKMSLEASKTAAEKRQKEEELERERVIGVLKTSSSSHVANFSSRSRSTSASISTVTSSDEDGDDEVDEAGLKKNITRRKPPSLPMRRPSAGAGSSASTVKLAGTSKPSSTHSNPPPVPPPPRRRPESMSGPTTLTLSSPSKPSTSTAGGLVRALSLSSRAARYKAEASMSSKRGFLPASGWVDEPQRVDGNGKVGLLSDEGPSTDYSSSSERDKFRADVNREEYAEL